MMKTIISIFLLSLTIQVLHAQDNFITKLRSESNIPGLQLVWFDGNKNFTHQSGTAFTGTLHQVKSSTLFQAASLSKVVLAYICLQLVLDKKLELDRPLYQYYDYPRMKGDLNSKSITARMILNHTTGWPNWTQNPLQKTWATSNLTTQFKPGEKWSYSGEGFVFLQLAIQAILKKDLQAVASEMVFVPLGMKNSSFIWKDEFTDLATYGFNSHNKPTERSEYFLPNASFSLLTTALDYSLFLNALIKRHLSTMLSSEVALFNTDNASKDAKQLFWGLGLGIQENELGRIAWHWGDNGDYKSFFMINPNKRQFLVCFTNSVNGLKLMKPLANHFFGNASWSAADWLEAK